MAGIDIVHVPFREANSALNAVVGGSVEMMFSIASTAAVADRAARHGARHRRHLASSLAPRSRPAGDGGIGTCRLLGARMERFRGAQGNAAGGRSGSSIRPLQRGLDDGELRQRLVAAGYEPAARNSPDDFARFIHADTAKWVALVEQTKMKGQ